MLSRLIPPAVTPAKSLDMETPHDGSSGEGCVFNTGNVVDILVSIDRVGVDDVGVPDLYICIWTPSPPL